MALPRAPYRLTVVVLLAVVLGACGQSSKEKNLANGPVVVDGVAATPDTPIGDPGPTLPPIPRGSTDCDVAGPAAAGMLKNWQTVVALAKNGDVGQWPTVAGSFGGQIDQFAVQLDTLAQGVGGVTDAMASVTYMQSADAIVRRGLSGDATAAAELAQFIGPDPIMALRRQAPIAKTLAAKGCTAG